MNNFLQLKASFQKLDRFLIFIFIYILIVGIIFQKILLPRLDSLHGGPGLLKGDNVLFQQYAEAMLSEIKANGWSHWKLYPNNHIAAGINVGIVVIVYFFFGVNPLFILPINAILHTISAFILMKIIKEMGGQRVSQLISAIIFTICPVTLIWVAQLHKDTYAILAWFLLIYSFLIADKIGSFKKAFFCMILTLGLFYLVRPQYIAFVILLILFNTLFVIKKLFCDVEDWRKKLFFLFGMVFILLMLFFKFSTKKYTYQYLEIASGEAVHEKMTCSNYKWSSTSRLLNLDDLFRSIASIRVSQICDGVQSNSMIDADFLPNNALTLLKYVPKAVVVGLFYPTPFSLLSKGGLLSVAAIGEMLTFYLFLFFIIYLIFKRHFNQNMFTVLSSSVICLFVFSLTLPNMGSLHRIRYPFFVLLISIGGIGAEYFWQRFKGNEK